MITKAVRSRFGSRPASAAAERTGTSLSFPDDDGLRLELVVAADSNPPSPAVQPEVPTEHAILGTRCSEASHDERRLGGPAKPSHRTAPGRRGEPDRSGLPRC